MFSSPSPPGVVGFVVSVRLFGVVSVFSSLSPPGEFGRV